MSTKRATCPCCRLTTNSNSSIVTTNANWTGAEVTEFLKGRANEFTIEPKKASGAPVKDITAASGFEGQDVFFTELWNSDASVVDGTHDWYMDGFEATYNPVVNAVQQIFIDDYDSTGNFTLTLDQTARTDGVSSTTSFLSANLSAYELKIALEELDNIEAVDVSMTIQNSSKVFLVTFTHDLGAIETMEMNAHEIAGGNGLLYVTTMQVGVTEVQTITTSSDEHFVYEQQTIHISGTGTFTLNLADDDDPTIDLDANGTSAEGRKGLCERESSQHVVAHLRTIIHTHTPQSPCPSQPSRQPSRPQTTSST